MNLQQAKSEIVKAYDEGDKRQLIILLLKFGTILLEYLLEKLKQRKHEKPDTESKEVDKPTA